MTKIYNVTIFLVQLRTSLKTIFVVLKIITTTYANLTVFFDRYETVILVCPITITPNFTWFQGTREIQDFKEKSNFTVKNANESSVGSYQCLQTSNLTKRFTFELHFNSSDASKNGNCDSKTETLHVQENVFESCQMQNIAFLSNKSITDTVSGNGSQTISEDQLSYLRDQSCTGTNAKNVCVTFQVNTTVCKFNKTIQEAYTWKYEIIFSDNTLKELNKHNTTRLCINGETIDILTVMVFYICGAGIVSIVLFTLGFAFGFYRRKKATNGNESR